jgi:hypothetical protein
VETLRGALDVLPVAAVPVELLDAIGNVSEALTKSAWERPVFQRMPYLETKRVFVARPTASIRIEKKTFPVFLGDVVVQVLCDRKLSMKLDSHVTVRQLPLSYQD